MGPAPGTHTFLSEDGIARIPFELDLNHIILTATVNGETKARLILDTGMPMPGLLLVGKENKGDMGMNYVARMPIPDDPGDGEPLMARIAEGVRLSLPGLELTGLFAIVEPEAGNLGSLLGAEDGVIGYELFSEFTVSIDFDKNEIILQEPDKFKMPPNAEELPLLMRNGFPWLKCSAEMIGGNIAPLELVVDIGASHAISLNVGTHDAIVPPDNAIETLLGKTTSGPIYGKVGRIKSLHLGDMELHDVMSSFQTGPRHGPSAMEKQGNLGNDAIRRFNVTFDYKNKRMILVPNSHFHDLFEYNMSGIEYSETSEGTLKVERVLAGSPAEETELSPGDLILSINGQTIREIGKDKLRKIFREKGARVRLVAMSPAGTNKDVTLTLQRII